MFLERNPDSVLVIVSTYHEGEQSLDSQLTDYERSIVLDRSGRHVGRLVYLFSKIPSKTTYPNFWKSNHWNQNLQRLSSFIGLRFADELGISMSLKCRSDAFLGAYDVCRHLNFKLLLTEPLLPVPNTDTLLHREKLSARLVTSDHAKTHRENPNRHLGEYHVADYWMFGNTKDLLVFYDIRPSSSWNGGLGIGTTTAVETDMTEVWMRDVGIPPLGGTVEELLARYMVVADSVSDVEFVWMRHGYGYHSLDLYLKQGQKYLLKHRSRACKGWWKLISQSRWSQRIRMYADRDCELGGDSEPSPPPLHSQDWIEFQLGTIDQSRKWEAAIILQGPRVESTPIAIKVFLERNDPAVLLIVTTYLPEDEHQGNTCVGSFLTQFEKDIIIDNRGPNVGRLIYLFLRTPDKNEFPEFWKSNFHNQNSQRLSTFIGLQFAHDLGIEFALKCRADSFLGMTNVCRFMAERYTKFVPVMPPPTIPPKKIKLRGRITVNDINTVRQQDCTILGFHKQIYPYRVCDFWFFGYTTDLMHYFDIREGSQWDEGRGISATLPEVETNMVTLWMKEIGIDKDVQLGELLARYLAVADSSEVEYLRMKPGAPTTGRFRDYERRGKNHLKQIQADLFGFNMTSHERWKQFVEEYKIQDISS